MKIGNVDLAPPFGLAPMAGMTDTAFRRLVKRRGGCGLVVTEMVSSEGLVRGIDRTLEYAEYTEEERPVSIQIFGGDPEKMAAAAQIVEGMGADIVDVNMGCPVPKIAKHNAGCSLMREPEHAQQVVAAMAKAVRIPGHGQDARGVGRARGERAGAGASAWRMPARRRSPSTAGRRRSPTRASPTGPDRPRGRAASRIPVFGSGDCLEPAQLVERLSCERRGRRAGRPRRAAQPLDLSAGRRARARGGRAGDHARGARPVPARVHRPAAARADQRGRRLPARRARSGRWPTPAPVATIAG